ncbi:MAG TPA: Fe2+-dependent dioxygenase [Rhizomicrobium sp.]|jgi:PKHD-type hydroxylase
MIAYIADFLSADAVSALVVELSSVRFANGLATAGWNAREVKNNLQLTPGMAGYDAAAQRVHAAFASNAIFQMAVRPQLMHPILFNRYDAGMAYGRHIDDAIMTVAGSPPRALRTDVSFTLFLSDPASYEGGGLAIDTGGAEQSLKPPAGTLVAYPSDALHWVEPVTSGSRLAAVGWVQSEVRDPRQRAILYDLDRVRRALFAKDGKTDAFDILTRCHSNLLRQWAEL